MKNWLIRKLGGVPKQIYMAAAESYEGVLATYAKRLYELEQENAGLEDDRAAIENASAIVSETLSETISRLNEANRTIHGLRQIVNGSAISSAEKNKKIEELQAEIEAKNAELARVKSEIIAISKVKADTTLKAENQRLKAELELLKRRKGKK